VDLIISGGKVFLTTAEQYPRCARFSILGRELKEDWTHNKLAVYTGGCVLVGEHLYAVTRAGLLKCLDWNTGAEKWSQRGFGGHGTLIAADNLLIVQASESGELRIVEATPAGYRERRRAVVFTGKPDTFTAPALAEGRLYCRSYEGEVVCLDLRARP
jgi:outer membrane protein assembly factor BamB